MRHPLSQKQQFLRSKGLSEPEIQIACERAGIFSSVQPASQTSISMPMINATTPKPAFKRILDFVNSTVAVSGIAYGLYWLYNPFLRSFLFGASSAKSQAQSIDESLKNLETKVERKIDELSQEVARVREEINKTSFQNIKSDLDAIKGLLLNKKQFTSPIVPPSIPAWQLAAASTQQQHGDDADEKHHEQDEETGSGSSETEVVTKNSDSSLEIM